MKALIEARIIESIKVKEQMLADKDMLLQLEKLAVDCLKALQAEGKIIFAGNGGSFADAQHLSAEFTSRFLFDLQFEHLQNGIITDNSNIICYGRLAL